MTNKPKTVLYRRKRQGKTDFKKRLNLLLSRKPRLVVRFTNKKIIAQLINFLEKGDKVQIGVDSSVLRKAGWTFSLKNIPAAYLIGLLFGKRAVNAGYKKVILDTGLRSPHSKSRIYAFLKGVVDGGLDVPHSNTDIFPDARRLSGQDLKSDCSLEFEKVKLNIK